jgi:hypothetical protein
MPPFASITSFRSHPQALQSGQKELPSFVVWIRSDLTRVSGTAVDWSAARAIRSVRHRETICGSRQGALEDLVDNEFAQDLTDVAVRRKSI